jgi:hypothetical protein
MVIKRFDPLSCAKIAGVLYAIFGLFFGAIVSLISVLGGLASAKPPGFAFGALFGVGAIILLPVIYGGMGFVFALLSALLYNGIAHLVGGIRMDVD